LGLGLGHLFRLGIRRDGAGNPQAEYNQRASEWTFHGMPFVHDGFFRYDAGPLWGVPEVCNSSTRTMWNSDKCSVRSTTPVVGFGAIPMTARDWRTTTKSGWRMS